MRSAVVQFPFSLFRPSKKGFGACMVTVNSDILIRGMKVRLFDGGYHREDSDAPFVLVVREEAFRNVLERVWSGNAWANDDCNGKYSWRYTGVVLGDLNKRNGMISERATGIAAAIHSGPHSGFEHVWLHDRSSDDYFRQGQLQHGVFSLWSNNLIGQTKSRPISGRRVLMNRYFFNCIVSKSRIPPVGNGRPEGYFSRLRHKIESVLIT